MAVQYRCHMIQTEITWPVFPKPILWYSNNQITVEYEDDIIAKLNCVFDVVTKPIVLLDTFSITKLVSLVRLHSCVSCLFMDFLKFWLVSKNWLTFFRVFWLSLDMIWYAIVFTKKRNVEQRRFTGKKYQK